MLKRLWILALMVAVTPSRARAEPTLQSVCQAGPCALVTAGTEPAPSPEVQRLAGQLQEAGGWTTLRNGHVATPDERNVEPFRQLLLQAQTIYGDREKDLATRAEEVRKMLEGEFFTALPNIAQWQDLELQRVMAKLCDQLLAVTPAPDQVGVARTCLVHLPDLRAQILEGKGASAFERIYERALADRARGHLELVTDSGCEISVAGLRTPTSYLFLSDPLPGRYNVVVYCGEDLVLFPFDAYGALLGDHRQLYLAARARTHLREQASHIPHLAFTRWRLEDAHRAAREFITENGLAAVVLVHAEGQLSAEIVRMESVVHLPTSAAALAFAQGTAPDAPASPRVRDSSPASSPRAQRVAARTLGASALLATGAGWALALWSSQGPAQRFIDSAEDKDLKQSEYDDLEASWRRSRIALHATSAAAVPLAEAALVLGRTRLRRLPRWIHWTAGVTGVALAAVGTWQVVQNAGCNGPDPRSCTEQEFQMDRGALLLYTAVPLLSEPLITTAWKPRLTIEASRTNAIFQLRWRL